MGQKVKTQQQNKTSYIKTFAGAGNWTQSGCVTNAPMSQLRVSFVFKLLNCFDAIGRNVIKQNQIYGAHICNKFIFL